MQDMIGDANPMVVANAVAALSEMQAISSRPVFQIDSASLFKLLRALNECTEWGQVFILDSLAHYAPANSKDAESIIERVSPRLQHANSAVVLSAVKVILKSMEVRPNWGMQKDELLHSLVASLSFTTAMPSHCFDAGH